MEQDLFKAVIHTALTDLFSNKTKQDKKLREEAYAWFTYDDENFLTFCDLADYDARQWKYVAYLIFTGKLTREDYQELMSAEEKHIEPKHPRLIHWTELPFSPWIGIVREFKTIEEANLYHATLGT